MDAAASKTKADSDALLVRPEVERREEPSTAQRLQAIRETGESIVDPLGVMLPLAHAHAAWLLHPQELAGVALKFSGDMARLQWQAWKRAFGLPGEQVVAPHPDDQRFADPIWNQSQVWALVRDWYLIFTRHVQDALYETPGLSKKERRRSAFWWRKWLNTVAPTNFLLTNPVAMRKAVESRGESLLRGARIFMDDMRAGTVRMTDPEDFHVGKNLATTRGAVVFRNRLLEVIHYEPMTGQVRQMHVVIVTPWIKKFYVLALTQKKSMIQYLLKQGFSVFITSWKNPGGDMSETTFDDYLTQGVDEIVRVACAISGSPQVHAVGYCIGGTLLSSYMAWLNRRMDAAQVPVAHWTLLATLVDFRRPGDIEVFIDEGSVRWLASSMASRGFLDGKEMAAAFRLLRSNSLVWHYVVHGWLYGEKPPPFDVLYWNMDTTRMPYRMHEYYLREMYLKNNLVRKNALTVGGEPIDLGRIVQPLYGVTAEDDHIAPWRSAFRINNHAAGQKRFVLSSSGHILGIVNPPVTPPKRRYWAGGAHRTDGADSWRERAQEHSGTWWEDWTAWLAPQCGPLVDATQVGAEQFPRLAPAPGTYVLEP